MSFKNKSPLLSLILLTAFISLTNSCSKEKSDPVIDKSQEVMDLLTAHPWYRTDYIRDSLSLYRNGWYDSCLMDNLFYFTDDGDFYAEEAGLVCQYDVTFNTLSYTVSKDANDIILDEGDSSELNLSIARLTSDSLIYTYEDYGHKFTAIYARP